MVAQAVRPEIVGRERELEELSAFFSSPDRASTLVLRGEAGSGKTTLWLAGAELAKAEEWLVLRSRPVEAEATLALAGIADLLEDVLDDVLPALPEPQRQALGAALLLEPGETPGERAVAAAFLTALRTLAERGPVLVAVDDVQWLDSASTGVLLYAVRRTRDERIRALLALRASSDDDSGARLRASLAPSPFDELTVGPLSLGAIHALLRSRLGFSPSRPLLRRIHGASGGNPFFALELGRALRQRGSRLDAGEPLPVPDDLTRLIEQRLAELPPDAKEALVTAAALPRPTVQLVADRPAALEPAVAAQVIHIENDRIRFAHPLLASVLYAGVNEERRRTLHRRLADRVESSEERARHLALAVDGPDADVAAALEHAAVQARGRGASAAAAELGDLSRGLTPPDAQDDIHRRTIAAAYYFFDAGDPGRAVELLEEARAAAQDGSARAEALVALCRLRRFGGDQPLAVELAREALAEAGSDDRMRCEAAQGLAATLFFLREDLEEGVELAAFAAEQAERSHDLVLQTESICLQGLLECLVGSPRAATTLRSAPDPTGQALFGRVVSWPTHNRGVFALWTDGPEAVELLRDARDASVDRGDEGSAPMALANLAVAEYLAGRWSEAARAAEQALETALQTGQQHNEAFALAVRALVRASRGDPEGCRADAAEAMGIAGERAIAVARINALWALGVLELSLGRAEEAARLLRPHRERLLAAGVGEPGSVRFVPDEIEAMVALGETEEAETPLAWLEERGRALDRASALAAAARCRGLLALADRDPKEALDCLEEALRQHDRVNMPFERARTLLAYGVALRHARRRRDARVALEEARAAFGSLGAALWEQKAAAELGRIGGRRAAGDELTPAEERVARLVAEGHTNKEVAAALFLSERTVEFHLTHVYRKLGVRSRAELARQFIG
jgi:DNA-binding CsgD family transcriptional regulator